MSKKQKNQKHVHETGVLLGITALLIAAIVYTFLYVKDVVTSYFGNDWPVDMSQVVYQSLLLCIIILMVLVIMVERLIIKSSILRKENETLQGTIEERNRSIEDLNMLLNDKRVFDSKLDVWALNMLPDFLKKYNERSMLPVVLIKVSTTLSEKEFASRSTWLLSDREIRFKCADNMFIFMIHEQNYKEAEELIRYLYTGSTKEEGHVVIRNLLDCKQIEEALQVRVPGLKDLIEG